MGKPTGYCVKCKKKAVVMDNPKDVKMKNGKMSVRGTCPKCGAGMCCLGKGIKDF